MTLLEYFQPTHTPILFFIKDNVVGVSVCTLCVEDLNEVSYLCRDLCLLTYIFRGYRVKVGGNHYLLCYLHPKSGELSLEIRRIERN